MPTTSPRAKNTTKQRPKVSAAEKARREATRTAAVEELSEKLTQAVVGLASAEGWTAAIKAVAALDPRRYSARNTLLITLQCPGATSVAAYGEWRRRGRQVRKGESAIRILAGMTFTRRDEDGQPATDENGRPRTYARFKTVAVFDISQTDPIDGAEAQPVPAIGAKVRGAAPEGMWSALAAHAERCGYTVERDDTGASDGWTNPETKRIRVSDADPEAHAAITLAHEVGHVVCGHVEDMAEYRTHRGRLETEAEAVAYILAAWFGLDAELTSAPYIAGWAGRTPEAVEKTMAAVLENVVKAVCAVLDSIDPRPADEDEQDGPQAAEPAEQQAAA